MMPKRYTKKNILAFSAAFLLVLGTVISLLVWQGYRTRAMRDSAWPNAIKRKVQSVRIEHADATSSLEKTNGRWFLREARTDGLSLRADPARVEAFLKFVHNNKPIRRLGPFTSDEAGRYGLDAPRARIVLGQPLDWEIDIGNPTPGGEGVYGESSLEPGLLLLLDHEYLRQVEQKPEYFFDLRLISVDPSKVTRFRFRDADGEGFMIRHPDKDEFVFTWPDSLASKPASAPAASMYLHALSSMQAASLVLPPRDVQPGPLAFSVEVWNEDGNTTLVEVFAPAGGDESRIWLGHSDWQPVYFTLDQERVRQLQISNFAVRDRRCLDFPLPSVARMRLRRGGTEQDFTRIEDGWTVKSTGRELLGVDTLLWRLRDTRYEEEPVDAPPPDAEAVLVWDLLDADDSLLASAVFYASSSAPAGRCWLKTSEESPAYPISDRLLNDLLSYVPAGPAL